MILGLDPGRDKMGWALVPGGGELFFSGIVPVGDLCSFLTVFASPSSKWEEGVRRWICERLTGLPDGKTIEYVALGNGTGSRQTAERLAWLGLRTVLVDERNTTLAARDLYWRLHRPVLWQRCLPRFLRLPPRVLDDMAAWAIALRGIEKFPRQ
ncbi:MAG: endonuclease [Synergistaceae bacterium]|jgi:RNase H-fold protein (predicted Holliday junction resolvase)|nr:endonuclease [Synergistaceae bacterium]